MQILFRLEILHVVEKELTAESLLLTSNAEYNKGEEEKETLNGRVSPSLPALRQIH